MWLAAPGYRMNPALPALSGASPPVSACRPGTRRVITTNAETNAWMVAINDRLGFVPVAVVPTLKRRL